MTTILLITLLGTVASVIVGTVWYSQATPMGRLHMRQLGFDKLSPEEQSKLIEEAKPHMWKSFLGQAILSAFTSFFISFITIQSTSNGQPYSIVFGYIAFAWLCFTVPVVGSAIIWGNVDRAIAWKKFIFDSGSYLVTMVIIALIAGLFI